jgi:hypothetical protein
MKTKNQCNIKHTKIVNVQDGISRERPSVDHLCNKKVNY